MTDLNALEQNAMNACKGYMTGYAMPFQEPVIRSLEQQGLVEVISYDPLEGGLYYVAARQPPSALERLCTGTGDVLPS